MLQALAWDDSKRWTFHSLRAGELRLPPKDPRHQLFDLARLAMRSEELKGDVVRVAE